MSPKLVVTLLPKKNIPLAIPENVSNEIGDYFFHADDTKPFVYIEFTSAGSGRHIGIIGQHRYINIGMNYSVLARHLVSPVAWFTLDDGTTRFVSATSIRSPLMATRYRFYQEAGLTNVWIKNDRASVTQTMRLNALSLDDTDVKHCIGSHVTLVDDRIYRDFCQLNGEQVRDSFIL